MTKQNVLNDSMLILKLDIRNLTGLIVKQYQLVIEAIRKFDSRMALDVIKNDEEINSLSEDIDYETIIIIAKHQPAATDLRRLMVTNKLAYELERVADYAKNLAEYVITGNKLNVTKGNTFLMNFEDMFKVIFSMLETNLKAFEAEDKVLAREALLMDNEIDALYQKNFIDLLNNFKETSDATSQHMISKAMILNKQIERAGDHLTNVSEQILSLIKGKRFLID